MVKMACTFIRALLVLVLKFSLQAEAARHVASQNVPSNFKDLIQKLVSVRHTDILLLICKQFLKELPAFPYVIFVGGTEIIFLLKWKTARLLLSVIVVTIMTIPKILLIRRQHSLNYSVAQRKNLDINCKKRKNENRQTSKRKTKTKTNRRLDGPYTDPLRRGRTIGQSMQREREYKRTHHPYRRRSCAVVSSSLDPAQEQRRSRHHHFSFGTLTSQ